MVHSSLGIVLTAEDLVSPFFLFSFFFFFEFIKILGLSIFYLLSLGMDSPNVNKSFENKLKTALNTIATSFGTCPLHTVNNAFHVDEIG